MHEENRGSKGLLPFEAIGVDRVPEEERTSTPWTFFGLNMGSALSLSLLIYGALAIEFGLGYVSALTSLTVGVLVGVLINLPLILIGSRAATNNSTASGAHFGVRGRLIGSIVGLAINLVYIALGIWAGGQVLVALLARLFGFPDGDAELAIAYVLLSAVIGIVAIYGYYVFARVELTVGVLGAVTFVLIAIGFSGQVDASYAGGEYLLGSYWKTWIFSAVALGVSGPMSATLFMGDWTRYISPRKHKTQKLAVIGSFGLGISVLTPSLLGATIAVALSNPLADFYPAFVAQAPQWLAIAILPLAIFGTVSFVATNTYSSGLDLDAIFPRLSRAGATVIAVLVSTALVFLGSFVWNAEDTVTAASLLLVAIAAPWAAVTGIGYLRCRGRYHEDDLQVFNRREAGGRYWYRNGINYGATSAWFIGSLYGCLAIDASPIYKGPLAEMAGGVDTSFLGSFLIAAILYLGYSWVSSRRKAGPGLGGSIAGPALAEKTDPGAV